MSRRKAFTLVELLVVIGIIAVLVGILLPTLSAARRAANTVACLSNVRQLAMAALLFAHEHNGYVPTSSDDQWAKANDPLRKKWAYRTESSHKDGVVIYDWASSLLPYLGIKGNPTFITAPQSQSKVLRCPSDQWMDDGQPGYSLFNNVTGGFHPISYGYNADISCVSVNGIGRFDLSNQVGALWGPYTAAYGGFKHLGQPLQCKLSKVNKPAEVLLFADCGTRPRIGGTAPLDYNDALYYTTNYMPTNLSAEDAGKLSGVLKTDWLKLRIPMLRHGGKIKSGVVGTIPATFSDCKLNVAFADGHGDTIIQSDFNKVRITPYTFRN
jgi:prepilin-type N-terminal cleavage/methylation domain-containing protein